MRPEVARDALQFIVARSGEAAALLAEFKAARAARQAALPARLQRLEVEAKKHGDNISSLHEVSDDYEDYEGRYGGSRRHDEPCRSENPALDDAIIFAAVTFQEHVRQACCVLQAGRWQEALVLGVHLARLLPFGLEEHAASNEDDAEVAQVRGFAVEGWVLGP